jgi:hypothetical protein
MTMSKISPDLASRFRAQPDATVHLIVRLADSPADAVDRIRARGLTVRRQFSLIRALAITGPAGVCLSLLDEPWVTRIEEDQEIRTMRP